LSRTIVRTLQSESGGKRSALEIIVHEADEPNAVVDFLDVEL
jgi:hypothetical protein